MKPNTPKEQPLPRIVTEFPLPNEVGKEIDEYRKNTTDYFMNLTKQITNDYAERRGIEPPFKNDFKTK